MLIVHYIFCGCFKDFWQDMFTLRLWCWCIITTNLNKIKTDLLDLICRRLHDWQSYMDVIDYTNFTIVYSSFNSNDHWLFYMELQERTYCDIQYEFYVSEGQYDSFYCLALYNLVLGLTTILLKSKLFKWWMSHGDMTDYGHATILVLLLGDYRYIYIH